MKNDNSIIKRSIKKPNYNIEISNDFNISEKRMSLLKYEEYILNELKKNQKKTT